MKKKVLVIAKTEPATSTKYHTTVCTAGITEDGEFIRLYPIPFTLFCDEKTKFKKFDWIEVDCVKSKDDFRKESYKVRGDIKVLKNVGTDNKWKNRNEIVLPLLSNNFSDLEKENASLGLIKPYDLIDLVKTDKGDGPPNNTKSDGMMQMVFTFGSDGLGLKATPIPKELDMYYRYHFRCFEDDIIHKIMCEDWEIYEAARSWVKTYDTAEKVWEEMYNKFFYDFKNKKDLYFFVGTHHIWKTWVIISVYYPPSSDISKTKQTSLFDPNFKLNLI